MLNSSKLRALRDPQFDGVLFAFLAWNSECTDILYKSQALLSVYVVPLLEANKTAVV